MFIDNHIEKLPLQYYKNTLTWDQIIAGLKEIIWKKNNSTMK